MAESMNGLKRTHRCTEVTKAEIGSTVTLMGWVQKSRNKGGIVFVDLRDRSGIMQIIFENGDIDEEGFEKAGRLRSEFVIAVTGRVEARSGAVNENLKTGEIEVRAGALRILSESETPPFPIEENSKTREEVRLKYRYLDLRRPDLQRNLIMRSRVAVLVRQFLANEGFLEIETPILNKSTPEGARDYLVPSRVHPGSFYALPQSPQIFKQLLMCSGYDRYFQIAKCFRDEDLRADRQPEFTQIDLEMSFVDMEDVLQIGEDYIKRVFKDALGVDVPTPFPRYTYNQVLERFGSDKPDIRFGMELFDLTDIVKDCGFAVFKNAIDSGGSVRGITAKNAVKTYSRKELDKLTEFVRGIGAKGLAWIRLTDNGISSSFGKFMTEAQMQAILDRAGAQTGDVVMIIADANNHHVLTTLGAVRCEAAQKLNLPRQGFAFLWVVEFPFFEKDEETGQWVAMHHPFTSPTDECLDDLERDKSKVYAKAYDMVLNGAELSSGSIRITNPELQKRMFRMLGLSEEEAYKKFGFLTDAFKYGAPPHGGMGIGLDRLVMQMLGASTLRDVIAFPKVQNASELMTNAPSSVDRQQLDELGIAVVEQKEDLPLA